MSSRTRKYLITVIIFLFPLVSLISFTRGDFMDKIFQPSKNYDQVINIGNNKNAVGNGIFR